MHSPKLSIVTIMKREVATQSNRSSAMMFLSNPQNARQQIPKSLNAWIDVSRNPRKTARKTSSVCLPATEHGSIHRSGARKYVSLRLQKAMLIAKLKL